MTGYRNRGTMTVDSKGTVASFGPWTEDLDASKSPRVQQIGRELDGVLSVALRYHSQNRAVVEKKPIAMAEPQVRASQARSDLRALAKARDKLATIKKDNMVSKASLAPYDYPLTSTNGSTRSTFSARSELRSVMRSMTAEQRLQALGESVEFRAALLEQPAAVSGMSESDYALINRAEIESKFGNELAQIGETDRAYEAAIATIRTVEQAIGNELRAVDAPATEPTPAPAPTSFD